MTPPLAIALTLLGHSCVLLEITGQERSTRLLLDPGSLTPPLARIERLDGILITHAHPDHVTVEQLRAATGHDNVAVYGDAAVCSIAEEAGIEDVHVIDPGARTVGGAEVVVSEWEHEVIYPGIPLPRDLGFHIAGAVFAPGDAFAVPDHPVDVLLLPTGAPWMKLSETVDYLRAVAPRIAIPVHDGGLAPAHQQMHRALIGNLAPEVTTILTPGRGETIAIAPTPRKEHA